MFSLSAWLLFILAAALAPSASGARPAHGHLDIDSEAHVRNDPGQTVAMLTRHNFNSTVKQDLVDHWVILFCVDWYEHCQGLWHDYRRMAAHWEKVMAPSASSWQSTAVRFAEVDCTVDKALCNENNVQTYPSVTHWKNGKFESEWEISRGATTLSGDLTKWIGKVLLKKPADIAKEAEKKTHLREMKNLSAHIAELAGLLSWKDPTAAAIGYLILAASVGLLAWILGTGLELDYKSLVCYAHQAKNCKQWPSALLPDLPEMPPPRTIVRGSLEL